MKTKLLQLQDKLPLRNIAQFSIGTAVALFFSLHACEPSDMGGPMNMDFSDLWILLFLSFGYLAADAAIKEARHRKSWLYALLWAATFFPIAWQFCLFPAFDDGAYYRQRYGDVFSDNMMPPDAASYVLIFSISMMAAYKAIAPYSATAQGRFARLFAIPRIILFWVGVFSLVYLYDGFEHLLYHPDETQWKIISSLAGTLFLMLFCAYWARKYQLALFLTLYAATCLALMLAMAALYSDGRIEQYWQLPFTFSDIRT